MLRRRCRVKELSLSHKLWFSYSYIFAAQWPRPEIFQTINSVSSNNKSLKYQSFTPSGCKVVRIRKFESVAKNQLLRLDCFCLTSVCRSLNVCRTIIKRRVWKYKNDLKGFDVFWLENYLIVKSSRFFLQRI